MSQKDTAYSAARAEAQKKANDTGYDHGLEILGGKYRSFMLPQKKNRCGHELRCEVVSCENGERMQVGHGHK